MRKALLSLERALDTEIAALSILTLPFRSVMSFLFLIADSLYRGARLPAKGTPRLGAASAFAARLSYIVKDIINCPTADIGADIVDALGVIGKAHQQDFDRLIAYAHFCELMPEVHRGYYTVTGSATAFHLDHISEAFAKHERRDIILNEIAMPFFLRPANDHSGFFEMAAADMPGFDMAGHFAIVKEWSLMYRTFTFDIPMVDDAAFIDLVGLSYAEFTRIRASVAAFAQSCVALADARERFLRLNGGLKDDEYDKEMFEWTVPFLRRVYFEGVIAGLAEVSIDRIEAFMRIFSFAPKDGEARTCGDGFFPPLIYLSDSVLFSPDVTREMLSTRNVFYALNKTARKKFDEEISQHFEPQLVRHAIALIVDSIPTIHLKSGVRFSGGEIDLLVYDQRANVTLNIQAKATIPPQGARMVQALEGRIDEALAQLGSFNALETAERERVIGNAVGMTVYGTTIVDVVLCRTCFGTNNIWARLENVLPVSLPMLRYVMSQLAARSVGLEEFAATVRAFFDEIDNPTYGTWKREVLNLGRASVSFPLFDWNTEKIDRLRPQCFPDGGFR